MSSPEVEIDSASSSPVVVKAYPYQTDIVENKGYKNRRLSTHEKLGCSQSTCLATFSFEILLIEDRFPADGRKEKAAGPDRPAAAEGGERRIGWPRHRVVHVLSPDREGR